MVSGGEGVASCISATLFFRKSLWRWVALCVRFWICVIPPWRGRRSKDCVRPLSLAVVCFTITSPQNSQSRSADPQCSANLRFSAPVLQGATLQGAQFTGLHTLTYTALFTRETRGEWEKVSSKFWKTNTIIFVNSGSSSKFVWPQVQIMKTSYSKLYQKNSWIIRYCQFALLVMGILSLMGNRCNEKNFTFIINWPPIINFA